MRGDYWTVREAVEKAANIWFSKELLDLNALIGLSSTGFRHTKFSSLPAKAPTSGRRVFFKERITPKKIILKIPDVLADDDWDPDPLPGEGKADTREGRPEDVESQKREAEHGIREIREKAWLKLKNDLGSGTPQASALPCRDTPPYHPNCANPIDVTPGFWNREDLSESSLDKPCPIGISSRSHLVLISKEELRRYLHREGQSIQAASAGSRRPGGHKPKYDSDKIEAEAYRLLDRDAQDAIPTLTRAQEKKLPDFLNTLGSCSEGDAQRAAEAHFKAKITRKQLRASRAIKGKPGRPRKSRQEIAP